MECYRPQRSIVLDGDISAASNDSTLSRQPGRMVFNQKNGYWTCHLEQHSRGLGEEYILTSREVKELPVKFINAASRGYINFYHEAAQTYLFCWCNTRKENLEDAVVLLLAVTNNRTFETQKDISGNSLHELFQKNITRAQPKFVNSFPKLKPARIRAGDSSYWMQNRQHHGRAGTELNNRSRTFSHNDGGYRRNCSRNFDNQNRACFHWSNRDQYRGGGVCKANGGGSARGRDILERSSDAGNLNKELSEMPEQLRSNERIGRSPQPLRDRGSAENSLDRSDEKREVNRDVAGRDDSTSRPADTRGSNSLNRSRFEDENHLPEQNPTQKEPQVCVPSPTRLAITGKSYDVSANSTRNSISQEMSPATIFTMLKKPEPSRTTVVVESSPRSSLSEHSCESPVSVGGSRFYNASSSSLKTPIFQNSLSSMPHVLHLSQNSSNAKRNGNTLLLSSSKKAKFNRIRDVHVYREDKENVQKADRSYSEIGFLNSGNTCYINTALQAVFKLDLFACALIGAFSHVKDSLKPNTVVSTLCELLVATKNDKRWKQTENFANELQKLQAAIKNEWKGFIVNQMQDSHEFLIRILSSANDTFDAKLPDQNPIKKNFALEFLRTHTCMECSHSTVKRESNYDLGVSLCKRFRHTSSTKDCSWSLQRLLKSSFKTEVIEFKCTQCGNDRCKVEMCLSKIPRIFIIQLKRYTSLNGQQSKDDTPIRVPLYLTLKDFMSADCSKPSDLSESEDSFLDETSDCQMELNSTDVDCQQATGLNGDLHDGWHEGEHSEEEQINKAISNSLAIDYDPEIEKAKEESLRVFTEQVQQNRDARLEDDEEDGAEEDLEGENYEANFKTGHLPHSYRIASVIKHVGGVTIGHYTCIASDSKHNWKLYDDEKVKNITEVDALDVAGQYGYVMLYIHKSLLKGPPPSG